MSTPPPRASEPPHTGGASDAFTVGGSVLQAAHRMAATDVAELSIIEARRQLHEAQDAIRLLEARVCRLTSTLTSRAARAARDASPTDDPRVGERAARDVRTELADDLRLSAARVRQAQRIGDRIDGSPIVADALDAGHLTIDHVDAIEQAVKHLTGDERRGAEAQLVRVARHGSPRDVRDAGVRLLTALDHDAAVDEERRRHARRSGKAVRRRDGSVRVTADFFGLQGEAVLTTFHAFRRPDRPGEVRTTDQRGADAFVDLCLAALGDDAPDGLAERQAPHTPDTPDAPDAPDVRDAPATRPRRRRPKRQHRVAPHIAVTIDLDTLLTGEGIAETDWSGPIPWAAIRDQLDGAGLSFIALRGEIPVAVTEQTRYVPTGTWRGIKLRDKQCIHVHCDLPAAWCQVAHLGRWFKDGGRLSLDTAGLLCTGHHRAFDDDQLEVTWRDGKPVVHPPGDPP